MKSQQKLAEKSCNTDKNSEFYSVSKPIMVGKLDLIVCEFNPYFLKCKFFLLESLFFPNKIECPNELRLF